MSVHMNVKIRLGPLVTVDINGANCGEIIEALHGHHELNKILDSMCSDLAERIYPEGHEMHAESEHEVEHES